eukprot:TRINITY_DN10325_c0_g1_i1.p1 TRINITY_DN10325_c0_g1~~TRINITY_DN10325_c0_g1_i1.p1  ORF type:complete len:368 (-),score=49.12 TRINITY_DN10325_c0_g1_i1:181-1284(-)
MTKLRFLLSIILLVAITAAAITQPDPKTLAQKVIDAIISYDANKPGFLSLPEYGPSIIYDGIWEASDQFGFDYVSVLNKKLDDYLANTEGSAYKVLHNITIPWGGAIGDNLGLFPIAYLSRVNYYNKHPTSAYNNATDIKLSLEVANRYVIPWPNRLPDGTISRFGGWPGEKSNGATFVWADDEYMGSTLLFRLAKTLDKKDFAEMAANWLVLFDKHLFDTSAGLYHHGYNNYDDVFSCCKWSRANGWTIWAHAEALLSLKHFNLSEPNVLRVFQEHAKGAANVLSAGLYHEVVDVSSTFLETSSSSMLLYSLIHGVQNGWIERSAYQPLIEKVYNAIASKIESNGQVNGIVEGTGIGPDLAFYEGR